MLRNSAAFLAALLLCAFQSAAQPLSAYTNIQNQVMVWDNGFLRKIDYLPPVQLKTGRTVVTYLDNSRSFKVYYGGAVRQLNTGFTNTFDATDNLAIFLNARSLNVFDNGTVKNLSLLCRDYYLGDSLIVFLDGVRSEWKAYYAGAVYPVENFLAGPAIDTSMDSRNGIKVSDNIAAYVNYANQFHLFYKGENIQQEEYPVQGFEVGRNTVAYLDANRMFKVFHSGATRLLEEFPPRAFNAGDNLVAYISTDGYFKIFYDDSVHTIGFFEPEFQVGDNIVAFRDVSGYLKVFYKGEVFSVDSYYPEDYIIQYNSLAYRARGGILRMFSFGEVYDVTNAEIDNWDMRYDVLRYRIGQNLYRIFYKGEEY